MEEGRQRERRNGGRLWLESGFGVARYVNMHLHSHFIFDAIDNAKTNSATTSLIFNALLHFLALCCHSFVPGVVLVCGGFGLFSGFHSISSRWFWILLPSRSLLLWSVCLTGILNPLSCFFFTVRIGWLLAHYSSLLADWLLLWMDLYWLVTG